MTTVYMVLVLTTKIKVFRYSFSETIPIFFNRLKSVFFLVRLLQKIQLKYNYDISYIHLYSSSSTGINVL